MTVVSIVTQMEAGGAQTALLRLASGLRRRGHVVETWFLYQKRRAFADAEGVRVLLPHAPRHPGDYVKVVWRLVQALRSLRPDAVITFTHYANILGQVTAALLGISCRVASQRNPGWSYPPLARMLDRILGSSGCYSHNVMVSESVARSFDRHPAAYRRKITVVPNGIQLRPAAADRGPTRERFQLPPTAPLILTVGRLALQKNQALLLAALAELPNAHLAIAGDGEVRNELECLAQTLGVSGRVHFLGEVPNAAIPDLLRTADVFALPSRFEGLSNALLEAMAAGVPVVASDIPAQAEVLVPPDREPVGVLVPENTAEAWANSIRHLLDDDQTRATLSERSRARSRDFTISAMVDGFESILLARREAASGSRSPETFELLGVRVHALDTDALHERIGEAISQSRRIVIAHHNLHSVYLARTDKRMREFYERADWTHVDGMAVCYIGRLLGLPVRAKHRVTYVDWLPKLMALAERKEWRVFYLGSEKGTVEHAAQLLRKQHSRLHIDTHHGYFDVADGPENAKVLKSIRDYKPQVLMVGMGMPRQEHWILANRDQLDVNVILPCGAAFDYLAGRIATPPRWAGRIGLEWLCRLVSEPRRLSSRYLFEPWFLAGPLLRELARRRLFPGACADVATCSSGLRSDAATQEVEDVGRGASA